jgi:hypothetical protein
VSLGSCFAVNMAEKLDYFKFQNTCNPFGILFHPLAIEKLIDFAVSQKHFTEKDLFFHEERWHSFDAHSDLSNSNKEELVATLNATLRTTNQQLEEATHIVITYGTSWVYRNLERDAIVANCHKVPQKQFKKELLSVDEIRESMGNTMQLIHSINPNCKFIFTVSPVRHIKDGFVENQLSKSHLITAIHDKINPQLANVNYFPSYEIVMDELRDYRFYAEDMLHPNQVAIDYIWERFSQTYIAEGTLKTQKEVQTIQKGLAHRPFNPNSESHRQFLLKLQNKMRALQRQFPKIQF